MKGYVQVYTGNGKGKTTAALGLTLRAVGAGKKVFILQFLKSMHYSELDAMPRLADLVTLKQCGHSCMINRDPAQEDIDAAQQALAEARSIIQAGEHDIVILDEANIATYYKLISVDQLMELIDLKPEKMELIITGRYADEKIIDRADLVTEMTEVKHYYHAGVQARKGIEK